MPGYFLNHIEHAADIIAQAGKPNVRMQFDFYHAQIVGGDLITRLEKYLPDHRPSAMRAAFRAATSRTRARSTTRRYSKRWISLGYRGWIGAEYRPRGRTEEGLDWAAPYGVTPRR